MPLEHLISMYGPAAADAAEIQQADTTLTTPSRRSRKFPAARPKTRRNSIFSYEESDTETIKEPSRLDILAEAAAIAAEKEEKYQDPPLDQQWPEGQRDVPPVEHDASGKPYVPESDPYFGINWILQAAGSMGDLPGSPAVEASSPESEPVSKKRKRASHKEQRSDTPLMPDRSDGRQRAEYLDHGSSPTESAWEPIMAPSEPEPRFRSFPTAEMTTRNNSISSYHPSTAPSSPHSSPESDSTIVAPITQTSTPSRRRTKKTRTGNANPSIKWSIDDGKKLTELRSPHRKGGPMRHEDVGEILGRSALSCRLHVNKLKKKGVWPWSEEDEAKARREGKQGKEGKRSGEEASGVKRSGKGKGKGKEKKVVMARFPGL